MQPQRRVSLPAPARTTRVNGGPRLRAGTPLPPYCVARARRAARVASGSISAVRDAPEQGRQPMRMAAPRVKAAGDSASGAGAVAGVAPPPAPDATTLGARAYVPPAIVEESTTFPMDAFIIPEGAARLPTGVSDDVPRAHVVAEAGRAAGLTAPASAVEARGPVDTAPLRVRREPERRPRSGSMREQRAHDVADRLEMLATQLRHHGYEVLAQSSLRGDALDALLAGVIAGYLVAVE